MRIKSLFWLLKATKTRKNFELEKKQNANNNREPIAIIYKSIPIHIEDAKKYLFFVIKYEF